MHSSLLASLMQDEISVPTEFVERWQDDFARTHYGWIKDPVDNFIRIDTSRIVIEHVIPGGVALSLHCGFKVAQKVIFCYQLYHN